MSRTAEARLVSWRRDPVAFITEALVDPETGRPFALYPAQVRFLREGFTLTADGRLPYPELVYSAPKKSGKSTQAAMATLYTVIVLGGPYAEGYAVANDLEQATSRVFRMAARMVEASPLLRGSARVYSNVIEFPDTGATITALASDYTSAAGANPTITCFDELWGYTSERSRRLWDELVPVPTRRVSVRFTTSYAGFENESELLESLHKRGVQGEEIAPALYRGDGLLMFWSHGPVAPWQTPAWIEQMRGQLRPHAFLRMVENRFVSGEEAFVPVEWWDACTDPRARPLLPTKAIPLVVGVDAAVKRDSAAVAAAYRDGDRVRVALHRIWQPTPQEPLDLEATIETYLAQLAQQYWVTTVFYDPTQFVRSAQTLVKHGLPLREWPQTVENVTLHSQTLYDLIKSQNLVVYPDSVLRLAVQRAIAKETPRGWKITKEKSSHKIDVVVALAMACAGGVQQPQVTNAPVLMLGDRVQGTAAWAARAERDAAQSTGIWVSDAEESDGTIFGRAR